MSFLLMDIIILLFLKLFCSQQCLGSDYCAHVFSLVAQTVKNLPAMWETWVRSLGWEDPLEELMATHSSILAWNLPMDRGIWQATVHGVAEFDTTEQVSTQS